MTAVCVWNVSNAAAAAAGGGGPTVNALANGDFNTRFELECYAGIKFDTDGNEYERTGSGTYGSSVNTWLTSGTSSEVWVAYTRNSGVSNFDGKTAGTRYQLNVDQEFYLYVPAAVIVTLSETINCYFTFYDAATGGNTLDTTTSASWTCESEAGGGPCPLCCFTPDTLVTMARGIRVPIASIRKGDMILTPHGPEEVTGIITRTKRAMYRLHLDDGRTIDTSDDHPFHVEGKGPAALNHNDIEYKGVGLPAVLEIGDQITDEEGRYPTVTRIEKISFPDMVYSLENPMFYANGLLVY